MYAAAILKGLKLKVMIAFCARQTVLKAIRSSGYFYNTIYSCTMKGKSS